MIVKSKAESKNNVEKDAIPKTRESIRLGAENGYSPKNRESFRINYKVEKTRNLGSSEAHRCLAASFMACSV